MKLRHILKKPRMFRVRPENLKSQEDLSPELLNNLKENRKRLAKLQFSVLS